MQIVPYLERQHPLPRTFEMTVVAQDPTVTGPDGKILRTRLTVPATRLEPGPRGERFHVVDYDVSQRVFKPPADLTAGSPDHPGWDFVDRMETASDDAVLTDPVLHAQNVYAIAARTLAQFEYALGRPVPWSFRGHELALVPHAFAEANAYYADDDQALYFGYFPARKKDETVYTCLSHDIVVHETTHAILDGLRSRFIAPGLPDQAAFHEGFADIVALLSVFSSEELVATLLGGTGPRLKRADVEEDRLKETALVKLAEQMGEALYAQRGNGLRRSVGLTPSANWKDPENFDWEEPHRRGEILVAAVMQTLVLMWRKRLEALIQDDVLDRARAAEEGSLAARHLLQMMIRAIDYCPPVEFEFEDFLDAVLVSDEEVAPDDRHAYRPALASAFGQFGIQPSRSPGGVDLSKSPERPAYRDFNAGALRSAPDEVARFIWQNARFLRIDPRFYLNVEDVWPSVRIGANGFVTVETVVDYVQEVEGPPKDLTALSKGKLEIPKGVPDNTKIRLWGGGTIIFDQFGGVKYHQTKPLAKWERQSRRLRYLVRNGLFDSRKQLGASLGTPLGQRFALYHQPDSTAGEDW